ALQQLSSVQAIDCQLDACTLTGKLFSNANANPVCTPICDQNGTTNNRFITQHRPGISNSHVAIALKFWPVRFSSSSYKYNIRFHFFDDGLSNCSVADNIDARALDFPGQIRNYTAKFRTAWNELSQEGLSAELFR